MHMVPLSLMEKESVRKEQTNLRERERVRDRQQNNWLRSFKCWTLFWISTLSDALLSQLPTKPVRTHPFVYAFTIWFGFNACNLTCRRERIKEWDQKPCAKLCFDSGKMSVKSAEREWNWQQHTIFEFRPPQSLAVLYRFALEFRLRFSCRIVAFWPFKTPNLGEDDGNISTNDIQTWHICRWKKSSLKTPRSERTSKQTIAVICVSR